MAGCTYSYLGYYKYEFDSTYHHFYRLSISLSSPFTSSYYNSLQVLSSSSARSYPTSGSAYSPVLGESAVNLTAGYTFEIVTSGDTAALRLVANTSNTFNLDFPIVATMPTYLTVYAVDANNGYYWSLSPTGTVASGSSPYNYYLTASSPRPAYFYWTYAKTAGQKFNLTAAEWNAMLSNINLVREYKGLTSYPFTWVQSGQTFTANHYNVAATAIKGISGYGAYLPTVQSGQTITASALNTMVSELNAVV